MTLVLLHGFTGGPTSWDAVVRALAAESPRAPRVVCPALAGHEGGLGLERSAWPALPERFEDEVDRLADALPRGTLHLVGYSLGARLALGLLVRHRVRFESATLVGVHPGLDDPSERAARAAADDALAARLEREGLRSFVDTWEALPLWATQRVLPPATLAAQRALRLAHDEERLAHVLRTLSLGRMPSLTSALPELDLPITLVTGGADAKFRALALTMEAALPSARALRVGPAPADDDAGGGAGRAIGHNVPLEAPGELARLLLEAVDV